MKKFTFIKFLGIILLIISIATLSVLVFEFANRSAIIEMILSLTGIGLSLIGIFAIIEQ